MELIELSPVLLDADLAHILISHGGAIAILVALGAATASVVERIKAHRRI
jgi:hypothetical protein